MRRCIPCILIAALSAACLFAVKPDPKAVIGKINDKAYTYAEYEAILDNYLAFYQNQQSAPLTNEEIAQYNDKCWEELVARYIYDQEISKRNLKLGSQELLAEAKKNPPASVKRIKDLQSGGKFDQKKYEKALNEAKEFREAVLEDVREIYIYTKLLNTIRSEATSDPDSVRKAWEHEQELVDARIIFFDANKMSSVTATAEESRQYYEGRKEEYRRENGRRYLYARFAKTATPEDSLSVREQVFQIYRELLGGADFGELARQWSQDTGSGKNGGDLGWFDHGKMVPEFEQVAFSTPAGEISEPFLSQFGWHIVQTTDRRMGPRGEEVSARHILIRINPSAETVQMIKSRALQLHTQANLMGLTAAASELGIELQETPTFLASDTFIRGLGRDSALLNFAFSNPLGAIPDIWYAPSGDAYVCEISAILPEFYIPYEEEASRIQDSATRAKRGFYMNEYVENFIANLKPDDYLNWASRDSIMVVELTGHKRGEAITAIGKALDLDETLFNTPEGTWAPLISEQMRWFLVRVDRHLMPDPGIWEQEKSTLLDTAKTKAQTDHLNDWYFKERQKLSIIDNRLDYYDLSAARKTQQIKLGG